MHCGIFALRIRHVINKRGSGNGNGIGNGNGLGVAAP